MIDRRSAIDHFADRLVAACKAKGSPVCVGIDPVWDRLPAAIREGRDARKARDVVAGFDLFVRGVLDAVAPHVPCVKFQSACFERYLWPGVESYHRLAEHALRLGLIVIGDAKRGDIGISAEHYAAGCLGDPSFSDIEGKRGPDALTINPYFGKDGVEPFVELAKKQGKGLFALVRTSNPGGDAIQSQMLANGRSVAEVVAQVVASLGESAVGKSGYSLLGAVVGATKPRDAQRLRELMPRQIFLVPGFGAQGGSADDVRACFKSDGAGAIITASRSVLFAYDKDTSRSWQSAVEAAAKKMKDEVAAIIGG
ncbi:MAG: orotidine-5'-phosphate decarboxylase [Planctomycetes bacterium]|nr:orotidine-5'-phosphate decarboxylase [Planctomycetota bacterium]